MKQRGLTLLEMILAAALALTFCGLVVYTLIPLLRYSSWASARASLVQAAGLAAERLAVDAQRAPWTGLSLQGEAVAIHPLAGVTDAGRAVWSDSLVLYTWDAPSGSLTRAVWKLPAGTPTDGPTLLPRPALLSALQDPQTVRHRLLAGVVKGWSLTREGALLRLHVTTELAVPGRELERLELTKDIALRNRGGS